MVSAVVALGPALVSCIFTDISIVNRSKYRKARSDTFLKIII